MLGLYFSRLQHQLPYPVGGFDIPPVSLRESPMSSLTDGAIRRAIRDVELNQKPIALADGEGRGTGRLIIVIRPMPTRVTADWMAQQWRDGGRSRKKLGSYPSMTLSRAREIFERDFA